MNLASVHVEEDLEARVEALIGDLEPEVVELLLGDPLQVLAPPPRQRVEDTLRELLGVHHPCASKDAEWCEVVSAMRGQGRRDCDRAVLVACAVR